MFTGFLQSAFERLVEHSIDGSIHYICMDWRHLPEILTAGEAVYEELKNLIVWAKDNGNVTLDIPSGRGSDMTCSFTPFGGGSRVVSLWDMLRFHADLFIKVVNNLSLVEALQAQPASFLKNKPMVQFFADQVKELFDQMNEVRLATSSKKAFELYVLLSRYKGGDHDATGQLIKQYSQELRDRLAAELEGRVFYYVPDHIELLSDPVPFGASVDDSFPSARYDISEAGYCLALRRSTACVLHLMRALEPCLTSLATAWGVDHAGDNWQNIIDRIEKEIRLRNKETHGEEWKNEDEPFFSGAASHFLLIKNAWRNRAMHARSKYTEEEAEVIYNSVRAFMLHLSERLSEEGLSS